MLYREAGQFKTTYAEDMAIFPIRQDRIALAILLGIAFIGYRKLLDHIHVDRHQDTHRSLRWIH